MSTLFSAVNAVSTRTWNGMKTNASSLSSLVDLFYKIGSARGKFNTISAQISGALAEDKDLAIRMILWARDARQGAGERQTFKDAVSFIAENQFLDMDEAKRVIAKIPELGRWDDLEVFVGTSLEDYALRLWVEAARKPGLAAKWAPRKGKLAAKMREISGMSPKAYRKMLVANTSVVETQMCAKQWDEINFSAVPSVAAGRYMKAFGKNAPEAYTAYRNALVKGDPSVKVNAGAVYPYDVVKSVRYGDKTVANAQWAALPDYMEGSEHKGILPLVDVSGSMGCPAGGYGSNSVVTCMDVAISLGLYLSERNRGAFKDEFITFDTTPQMLKTAGTLSQRVHQMERSEWGGSTNLTAAFELILNAAVKNNVSQEDMPSMLLILSDMQFNQAVRYDDSAIQMITRKYENAGYKVPQVVFWNINSSGQGVPVTYDKKGVALVSGFSPSIMKSVLRAEKMDPLLLVKDTLMVDRYNW